MFPAVSIIIWLCVSPLSLAFQAVLKSRTINLSICRMVDQDTLVYGGVFLGTLIPSIAFSKSSCGLSFCKQVTNLYAVKFVGDRADSSRGSLSTKTKEKFVKSMMEQPGANFALPSAEEEEIKKMITKAYMQDKDVDVAVLEEKLRARARWRKEMQAKKSSKLLTPDEEVDDDGW